MVALCSTKIGNAECTHVPEANPTITSYNANESIVHFENKSNFLPIIKL
jgi:hypothetical protein